MVQMLAFCGPPPDGERIAQEASWRCFQSDANWSPKRPEPDSSGPAADATQPEKARVPAENIAPVGVAVLKGMVLDRDVKGSRFSGGRPILYGITLSAGFHSGSIKIARLDQPRL
jgi:hypothetical protein